MRKTGDEKLSFNGRETGLTIQDFWSWAFSDLLDNTLRGSYAEFIVAAALGIDLTRERANWEPWDLTMQDIKVEVKSCSYVQTWEQERPSAIKFSIRPSMSWSAKAGFSGEQQRPSDVYVFCLYAEKDAARADPLRLDGWEFYVLPTRRLDESCGGQKSIALSSLLQLDPVKTDYEGLKAAVQSCV